MTLFLYFFIASESDQNIIRSEDNLNISSASSSSFLAWFLYSAGSTWIVIAHHFLQFRFKVYHFHALPDSILPPFTQAAMRLKSLWVVVEDRFCHRALITFGNASLSPNSCSVYICCHPNLLPHVIIHNIVEPCHMHRPTNITY